MLYDMHNQFKLSVDVELKISLLSIDINMSLFCATNQV